jgi:hypothetical protein
MLGLRWQPQMTAGSVECRFADWPATQHPSRSLYRELLPNVGDGRGQAAAA